MTWWQIALVAYIAAMIAAMPFYGFWLRRRRRRFTRAVHPDPDNELTR